jgi:hypothetical protein
MIPLSIEAEVAKNRRKYGYSFKPFEDKSGKTIASG